MFGNLVVDENANADKMEVERKNKTRKIKKIRAQVKPVNKSGKKRKMK